MFENIDLSDFLTHPKVPPFRNLIDGNIILDKCIEQYKDIKTSFPKNKRIAIFLFVEDLNTAKGKELGSIVSAAKKQEVFLEIGVNVSIAIRFPSVSPLIIENELEICNNDPNILGIIFQKPVPSNIEYVVQKISILKDIDGLRIENTIPRATAEAVMKLVMHFIKNEDRVVVVGAKGFIGSSILNQLKKLKIDAFGIDQDDDFNIIKEYPIIISATGCPELLKPHHLNNQKLIVDIGYSRDQNGKVCGDVSNLVYGNEDLAKYILPVPGGCGPLEMTILLERFLACCDIKITFQWF